MRTCLIAIFAFGYHKNEGQSLTTHMNQAHYAILILVATPVLATANEPRTLAKGFAASKLAFSADGRIAAGIGFPPTEIKSIEDALAPRDSLLRVWDVKDAKEVFRFTDTEKNAACLAVSSNGAFLAVGYQARALGGEPANSCPLIVWRVAEKD